MPNQNLRDAIYFSRMKQFQIAKQLGWSEPKLSQLVNDHRPATDDEKEQLAKTLGKEISDLWPNHNFPVIA